MMLGVGVQSQDQNYIKNIEDRYDHPHSQMMPFSTVYRLPGDDPTQVATGAYCGPHHICLRGYCVDAYTNPLVYVDDDFVEIHTSEPPGESVLGWNACCNSQ